MPYISNNVYSIRLQCHNLEDARFKQQFQALPVEIYKSKVSRIKFGYIPVACSIF